MMFFILISFFSSYFGVPIGGCISTRYGCCLDGITPAKDFEDSCRVLGGCSGTIYGCCVDETTPAKSHDDQCKILGGCIGTKYGCCLDGNTTATSEFDQCKFVKANILVISSDYNLNNSSDVQKKYYY